MLNLEKKKKKTEMDDLEEKGISTAREEKCIRAHQRRASVANVRALQGGWWVGWGRFEVERRSL